MTEPLFPLPRETSRLTWRHEFNSGPLDAQARGKLRTVQAVVAALERLVKTMGSVASVGRHLNISRSYLSMVLGGTRAPSEDLAHKLGFAPITLYVRVTAFGDDYGEGRLESGAGEAESGPDQDAGGSPDEGTEGS